MPEVFVMSLVSPSSNARAFFEEIVNQPDPYTYLRAIPDTYSTAPFFEEEWIDFKGNPATDNDAKKIWSKVLSGYANITDGLVIWGIDARKTAPRNIDAACGLRLIPNPHGFESKLRDWIRDATNPPVMNVEYKSYLGPTGEGFVVCLVPISPYKPHRGEFADRQYYYRAGDDFLPAEPGLLRILFYPQSNHRIWAEVEFRYEIQLLSSQQQFINHRTPNLDNKSKYGRSKLKVDVKLHNDGTATARDLYVICDANYDIRYNPGPDWDAQRGLQPRIALRATRPVHPGEVVSLFTGRLADVGIERLNSGFLPIFDKVTLDFAFYAEGSQPEYGSVEYLVDEFDLTVQSITKQCFPEFR